MTFFNLQNLLEVRIFRSRNRSRSIRIALRLISLKLTISFWIITLRLVPSIISLFKILFRGGSIVSNNILPIVILRKGWFVWRQAIRVVCVITTPYFRIFFLWIRPGNIIKLIKKII